MATQTPSSTTTAQTSFCAVVVDASLTNFILCRCREQLGNWRHSWPIGWKLRLKRTQAQRKIKWKFKPPGAPHLGGIWERQVQNWEKLMVAILNNRILTDEVLCRSMCLLEQTLNVRPLTALNVDPRDLPAFTPNQFLLGLVNASQPLYHQVSATMSCKNLSERLKNMTNWSGGDVIVKIFPNGTKDRRGL